MIIPVSRGRTPAFGLADSLSADLRIAMARRPDVDVPKAKLTRQGGRCPVHGTLLLFDPFRSHVHRCTACGHDYTGDTHDLWWAMGYQLWLAERCVHAAALQFTEPSPDLASFATTVLQEAAEGYLGYRNADNVLGPSRPFFSTYLESLWLLHLAIAMDLLESLGCVPDTLGAQCRERLFEPSAALIASFDEGGSNRQVWNNAALLAASRVLGDDTMAERAIEGPSGLRQHLANHLLPDGTWFEGENYHQFAHRGLWYGVEMARARGVVFPPALVQRFGEGFHVMFRTALPDFTMPARRDSQYGVSLRQWRFAELAELGWAQTADERLLGVLAALYRRDVPAGDSGRWKATGEAERNEPEVRLDRSMLGWKSLLTAAPSLPTLPDVAPWTNTAVHLTDQGLAIFRRATGRGWVALDYGVSGGGHGHPDRLNLWLVTAKNRWLEDVGTGSYVDPALFWYRSTLAHNAPMVDGASQPSVSGELIAFDERDGVGMVAARLAMPGIEFERRVVALDDYLVDELRWRADAGSPTVDLPWHVDGTLLSSAAFSPLPPGTSGGGYEHCTMLEEAPASPTDEVQVESKGEVLRGWVASDAARSWLRLMAPGAPGEPPARFLVARCTGATGVLRSVWSWGASVEHVVMHPDTIEVHRSGHRVDVHRAEGTRWHWEQRRNGTSDELPVVLDGHVPRRTPAPIAAPTTRPPIQLDPTNPWRARLGEPDYRQSEEAWSVAGAPEAEVAITSTAHGIEIAIIVRKRAPVCVAPPRDQNLLDNEDPDINSDGVQLHLVQRDAAATWLVVPQESSPVRVKQTRGTAGRFDLASQASLTADGYRVQLKVTGLDAQTPFRLGVTINEISPDRERRRGQLVLGRRGHPWVYLRGDRETTDDLLLFRCSDG